MSLAPQGIIHKQPVPAVAHPDLTTMRCGRSIAGVQSRASAVRAAFVSTFSRGHSTATVKSSASPSSTPQPHPPLPSSLPRSLGSRPLRTVRVNRGNGVPSDVIRVNTHVIRASLGDPRPKTVSAADVSLGSVNPSLQQQQQSRLEQAYQQQRQQQQQQQQGVVGSPYLHQPSNSEVREFLLGEKGALEGPAAAAAAAAAAVVGPSTGELSYELVQGALVRWTDTRDRRLPPPPTAVLIHGILGSGKNWGSFARRLAQEFPSWQFLSVDLRCHGESTDATRGLMPHSVQAAAQDVLMLMFRLCITPHVLIGHSFGGKVALSMVDQAAKPLARPIKVWVLDATPGRVRAGGDGEDHPADLIEALRAIPPIIFDRREVASTLCSQGFSKPVAQWMTTNLRKLPRTWFEENELDPPMGVRQGQAAFGWSFDLQGISQMYKSYEGTNLWPLVDSVPEGVHINFLRAERSLHRWARNDIQRILSAESLASDNSAGVQMHVLEDSGHWVHTDNPDGLFQILAPSFGQKGFGRM